ncbi:MAG: SDR family NAD(P)-dependent oxidoreductase [Flavobacterium sp.]
MNTKVDEYSKNNENEVRKSALITGANKGIGFETARQLLQKGFYVYMGTRDLKNGIEAVEKLRSEGLDNAEAIQLDVTDDDSVKTAREEIGRKTQVLDVLINNAGINGGAPYTALEAATDQFMTTFNTNVFGVARVTRAFIDLMHRDPNWPAYDYAKYAVYGSSKAAMNMYTVHLAYELRDTAFKINAVCPGYTKTDFTHHNGGEVEEAGKRIIKYALIDQNGPTGKFFSEESNPETGEISW